MKETLKALPDKSKLVSYFKEIFNKEKVEQIARKRKFVQRQSRLMGMDFLLLCMYSHQQDCEISLDGLANEMISDGIIITKQSVDGRFNNNASEFMKDMLSYALSEKLNIGRIEHSGAFGRIILEDSTQYQLPPAFAHKYEGSGGGASQAAVKIQFAYDLLSQQTIEIVSQSGNNSDLKQSLGEVKKTT